MKEITGYEGLYWIDSAGSILTKNWRNSGKEAILKPATDKKGYLRVGLMKEGKLSTLKVHRLVAIHFLNSIEGKNQVNHKNCIKSDNRVENLEWCTPKENTSHAITNGIFRFNGGWNKGKTTAKGEEIGTSILTSSMVIEIRLKFKKRIYTRKMLSLEYGVTENCIKDVFLRNSWKHL